MFIIITTEGPNDKIRASNATAKSSGAKGKEKAAGAKVKTFELIQKRDIKEKVYDLEDGKYRKEKWLVKEVRSKRYFELSLYRQLDTGNE